MAGWLLVCFAAAALGAVASASAGAFYAELARPAWAPPAWVFAPVWTTLYALMAVSAWLISRVRGTRAVRSAVVLFLAQLAANALWSWLFFAWRYGSLAFAEVLFLWLLIVATVVAFWRIRVMAAVLLLPYLVWVTFASALTWAIWRMNPALLS